jgi:hypothetical protein
VYTLSVKTRKSAGKTDTSRAKPDHTRAERAKLEKELRAAIAEVDEKGLLFLLRQAQVLIHNARVESLGGGAPREAGSAPPAAAVSRHETVSIEDAEGGKTIFLNIGRARKVLAPDEMKRLVRICYAAETRSEALRQLFTVLVKERRDILTDAMIGGPDSPLLRELFTAVREKYQLPER